MSVLKLFLLLCLVLLTAGGCDPDGGGSDDSLVNDSGSDATDSENDSAGDTPLTADTGSAVDTASAADTASVVDTTLTSDTSSAVDTASVVDTESASGNAIDVGADWTVFEIPLESRFVVTVNGVENGKKYSIEWEDKNNTEDGGYTASTTCNPTNNSDVSYWSSAFYSYVSGSVDNQITANNGLILAFNAGTTSGTFRVRVTEVMDTSITDDTDSDTGTMDTDTGSESIEDGSTTSPYTLSVGDTITHHFNGTTMPANMLVTLPAAGTYYLVSSNYGGQSGVACDSEWSGIAYLSSSDGVYTIDVTAATTLRVRLALATSVYEYDATITLTDIQPVDSDTTDSDTDSGSDTDADTADTDTGEDTTDTSVNIGTLVGATAQADAYGGNPDAQIDHGVWWISELLNTDSARWFTFNTLPGVSYDFYVEDMYTLDGTLYLTSDLTSDVLVSLYEADGTTPIFEDLDYFTTAVWTLTSDVGGWLVVKVTYFGSDSYGTFGMRVEETP